MSYHYMLMKNCHKILLLAAKVVCQLNWIYPLQKRKMSLITAHFCQINTPCKHISSTRQLCILKGLQLGPQEWELSYILSFWSNKLWKNMSGNPRVNVQTGCILQEKCSVQSCYRALYMDWGLLFIFRSQSNCYRSRNIKSTGIYVWAEIEGFITWPCHAVSGYFFSTLYFPLNFLSVCLLILHPLLLFLPPPSHQLLSPAWVSPPCTWRGSCIVSQRAGVDAAGASVPWSCPCTVQWWSLCPGPVTTNITGKVRDGLNTKVQTHKTHPY